MNSPNVPEDPLSQELAVYNNRKTEWLKDHRDQFVVIAGEQIAGFYADYESAFKAAIRAFGIGRQFLIKQVCVAEPVYVVY
jgi:hypothetical protein